MNLFAQDVQQAQVKFIQTQKEEGKEDQIVKGEIFYSHPGFLLIKINSPVSQVIQYNSDNIKFYYPTENIVYIFPGGIKTSPVIDQFTQRQVKDMGLSSIGFVLDNQEKKDDHLITFWLPPDNLKKVLDHVELEYANRQIVAYREIAKNGRVTNETKYSDFDEQVADFPKVILSKFVSSKGTSEFEIEYLSPIFNEPLPDDILEFEIPKDANIKDFTTK